MVGLITLKRSKPFLMLDESLSLHVTAAVDRFNQRGFQEIGIEPANEGNADSFRALRLTFSVVSTGTETLGFHLRNH